MTTQDARAAASDRIRVGVIGCGGMGRLDLADFQKNRDVEIAAVCDVFEPNLQAALRIAGERTPAHKDFRRILEDKSIDAVVVATPDHWHPVIAIEACNAGKDVYVEKPISHTVREGRLMVECASRQQRVVQVGIQQRSGSHFQRAVKIVQDGRIGDVLFAQCWNHNFRTDRTGIGHPPDGDPPATLDWDMWLGPAPKVPYNSARQTKFRVFWDYAGGELTNWCVHLIDIVHWAVRVDTPATVVSSGGKWYYQDCRECADTQEVIWEYPGNLLVRYSTMMHSSFGPNGDPGANSFGSYGVLLQGTKGTLFIDRAGYRLTPQPVVQYERGAESQRSSYDDLVGSGMYYTTETAAESGVTSPQHAPHVRNFLDCVKSRKKPVGDIETGHKSTATCLIGNVALRTGLKLHWDGGAERFTNSEEANRMLTKTYRKPWHLPGLSA